MISGIKPHQSEQRSEKIGVPPGEGALGIADFLRIRQRSAALCAPLEIEDYGVQPMADASPPKWHLAHTTWFFETFLVKPNRPVCQSHIIRHSSTFLTRTTTALGNRFHETSAGTCRVRPSQRS